MKIWVIVQHSGFGYAEDPQFERGLEQRLVSPERADRLEEQGAKVFDNYLAAADYCDAEPYPEGYSGLIPQAPGAFLKAKVDGLRVYTPKK